MANENQQASNGSASSAEVPGSQNAELLRTDPLKALSAALKAEREKEQKSGGDAEEQEEDDGKPAAKSKSKPPKKFEQIAEALGLELDVLYDVEVPAKAKGAKALTLGELKDLAAEHGDYEVAKLRLDEDRRAFEAAVSRGENELRELLSQLPADAIKPEKMQKLRELLGRRHQEQKARTLEVMPEWENVETRKAQMDAMSAHLKDYNLSDAWLLQNLDHRLMRLVRDAARDARTIRKALGEVKERKGTTPPKARGGAQPAVNKKTNGEGIQSRQARNVASFMETIHNAASQRGN